MAHLEALVVLDVAGKSGAALAFGFERAGLKAYATREPDDAFSMARTRVPQLVVVTVDGNADQAAGTDALALVGRLREEAETRELPIVAVGDAGRREEALRAGADEYVTRPAFIRDVLTLARLAVAVRQDGDPAGVVGMLEDYGLYFLVRALAVAGRSCVLELERGERQGEVHLAKGAVSAARVGRMSGIAALQHLMLWGEAGMALRFESPAGERRITAPVDDLLEQGVAFAHEFERLAALVGGAQAVYAQEPRRAAEQHAHIPGEVMTLVRQYDGRKPLIDIVEDSPFKPFDTIKITHRLSELGAIERRPEPRDIKPLTAQLAVREWLLGADGREEAAPRGEARGVTEAGRRAAEAYAAEAAAKAADAAEPSPGDDILNDTIRTPTVEPEALRPEPAAPREEIDDGATVRERRGPAARKKRKSGAATKAEAQKAEAQKAEAQKAEAQKAEAQKAEAQKAEAQKAEAQKAEAQKAEAQKPEPAKVEAPAQALEAQNPEPQKAAAPKAEKSANGDSQKTQKHSPAKGDAGKARPSSEGARPANGGASAPERMSPAAAAAAPSKNVQPPLRANSPTGTPAAGAKLTAQAIAGAHTKEPVFNDLEEDFFARESELSGPHTVETFDDLEHPRPKLSNKRSWFGFRKK